MSLEDRVMSAFKRLVIEALVESNHLSLINPILGNVKAQFSGRCAVTESIDESSGAANIFVTIEGNLEFSDLEEVGLEIIKLNNLGCRVAFFDRLEMKKFITHTNNALVYGRPDTPLVYSQPQMREAEVRQVAARPRWGRSVVLGLVVFLATFAYKAVTLRDTTPSVPPTVTAQPTSGESLPFKPGTPSPLPTDPSPTQIPQFQMPMLGVPIGNAFVNKATLEQLQKIARDYHATHTYSMDDLFVCVDMAIDVWNILKTKKINAKILAGRVDQDITHLNGLEYIGQINHAWVVAEPQPGVAVPLETTGGYVVSPDKPNYRLYFEGTDFSSPKAFKEFIELRGRAFSTCQQVQSMENHFNATFAGRPITQDSIAFKGRLDQKVQDCVSVLSQLQNVLLVRN
jgi:hypothetical protein